MRRAISDGEKIVDVSAAAGAGKPKRTERFDLVGATVQVVITSGSVDIEASNDGLNYIKLFTGVVASTIETLSANYSFLRILTTAPTDAVATLHAHELLY